MSRILQAVHKALRMAGTEPDLPKDPPLSVVVALLRSHGLRLSVVDAEETSLRLSARWLLRRAVERALAAGEPEYGLTTRIARLIGRSHSNVTRALAGEHGIDEEGRAALEEHLLHGKPSDLSPVGKSPGRPKKVDAPASDDEQYVRDATERVYGKGAIVLAVGDEDSGSIRVLGPGGKRVAGSFWNRSSPQRDQAQAWRIVAADVRRREPKSVDEAEDA